MKHVTAFLPFLALMGFASSAPQAFALPTCTAVYESDVFIGDGPTSIPLGPVQLSRFISIPGLESPRQLYVTDSMSRSGARALRLSLTDSRKSALASAKVANYPTTEPFELSVEATSEDITEIVTVTCQGM
ncbi:MAG: hypothetical protein AB7G93_05545 [Bdellovibrionales bacterium]